MAIKVGSIVDGRRPEDIPNGDAALASLRGDLRLVAGMIEPRSRVLDIGCGEGELLAYLAQWKGIDARGMELSQTGVNACVRRGLSVIQGDADNDLGDYPSDSFDYVVLSQTLQATYRPRLVMENMVRIGRHAIVSFPNFAHWRMRLGLLFGGRMPITPFLGQTWYDTPNIHFCTVLDFGDLCDAMGATIELSLTLDRYGRPFRLNPRAGLANLLAEQALFLLRRAA
jgi:methionine biosynthesis protein MetW